MIVEGQFMINKLVIIILLLGYFVTGVYAGEVTVSSGTSVDLTAHPVPTRPC